MFIIYILQLVLDILLGGKIFLMNATMIISSQEGSYSEDLYKQLDQAWEEVARAKQEALEELIRRQKAEKTANDATRKVKSLL